MPSILSILILIFVLSGLPLYTVPLSTSTLPRRTFIVSSPILLLSPNPALSSPLPTVTPVPKPTLELYNRALSLQSTGNLPSSLPLLQRVTDMTPNWSYGWSSLGDVQVALGDVPSALKSYESAIDLDGNEYGSVKDPYLIRLNYGCALLNSGEDGLLPPALAQLEAAARLRNRPDALTLVNRGLAYDYLKRYPQAVSDYEVAVQLSKEVQPWWLRRAMCKLEIGDASGARDAWRRVENRFPDSAEVNIVGYVIHQRLNEGEKAKECLGKVPEGKMEEYRREEVRRRKLRWGVAMEEGFA
eukprot:CAMPEP_0182474498 /NCGR_PEP_ID=MMETSP1319-20130603/25751_1 /TAXON_ID=172717 /ORGANISM="Bolidomonas pacifica, Strain RCC208" /LENGTH=299 /DNA_ID=CAMNT_0024675397 /DNA_START=122 /DNA_END=1017 /DNA_ORIENTATION=+